jgi:hypothetical protein
MDSSRGGWQATRAALRLLWLCNNHLRIVSKSGDGAECVLRLRPHLSGCESAVTDAGAKSANTFN